ncbi:uncharacterized protein LOC124642617 isoform X2 [Helicoverpa zea]|uniref:uncharacterized protein LOC124642617 isoform X2 n=1 Tax=Helicoverpa zea TaxID=7113 RepID=UPI001F5770AA|nr:uncharacterized protein LOC124642617 isoform X2 [Helicoverpa zea]
MPTLFESKLGWLLSGVIKKSNSSSHLCLLADTLQADLNRFSKPDSVSAKHTLTREERSCEELSLKSTYRDADGRFVISIPLKESPDILGDSYNMAKRRLALPYTLGLNWRCSSHTFSFSMSNATSSNIATKRKILSVIAQIFDSIGLVVPCIVEAKIIMQQLWLIKCSWDEPVPEHIQHPRDSFQNSLPFLNDFRMRRWITCESSSSVQLQVFTDASERAYGACLHVRSVSLSGEVHIHLLTATSKLAPVKSTTIPRLELCAALLSSRLYVKVQNDNVNNLQRFRRIECLKQHFWPRFSPEYILWLQQRTK